jgi:hypothetical protein
VPGNDCQSSAWFGTDRFFPFTDMMRQFLFTCLALAIGLAGGWYWLSRPGSSSRKQEKPVKEAYGYLYCPECRYEITCMPSEEDSHRPCPRCFAKKHVILEFSTRSHASELATAPSNPAIPVVVIGLTIVLGAAWLVLSRIRPRIDWKRVAKTLNYTCVICRRRLRYSPQQAGHKGACPRCKTVFTFPKEFKAAAR